MDYKEKYEMALEIAQEMLATIKMLRLQLHPQDLFLELTESEDESIRKAMINYFTNGKEYLSLTPYSKEDYIAWLEKQGDQKSVEWSEEDESTLNDITHNIHFAETHRNVTGSSAMEREQVNWLKSLRSRVQSQPKHEWNEEDKKMKDVIYSCVDSHYDGLAKTSLLIWIKSLKDRIQPQQGWSEEDKVIRNALIKFVELLYSYGSGIYDLDKNQFLDWLQALENRMVSK